MRSGTLWLAMLNPLLSLAMSILLLSLVLKRNFFMRMEKCGSATNHSSSSKQAKLDWRTGNIGERKKCSWPNPVAQNTRDPFFCPSNFFLLFNLPLIFPSLIQDATNSILKALKSLSFLSEGWTNFRIEWTAFLTKCICHWYQIKILWQTRSYSNPAVGKWNVPHLYKCVCLSKTSQFSSAPKNPKVAFSLLAGPLCFWGLAIMYPVTCVASKCDIGVACLLLLSLFLHLKREN